MKRNLSANDNYCTVFSPWHHFTLSAGTGFIFGNEAHLLGLTLASIRLFQRCEKAPAVRRHARKVQGLILISSVCTWLWRRKGELHAHAWGIKHNLSQSITGRPTSIAHKLLRHNQPILKAWKGGLVPGACLWTRVVTVSGSNCFFSYAISVVCIKYSWIQQLIYLDKFILGASKPWVWTTAPSILLRTVQQVVPPFPQGQPDLLERTLHVSSECALSCLFNADIADISFTFSFKNLSIHFQHSLPTLSALINLTV